MDQARPHDDVEYCQAKFIINALRDGWTVKMDKDGSLVFVRDRDTAGGALAKDYTQKFLEKYGKIN